MPPSQTPHRTPLRRVSQGSLFRLSRSGAYPDAPHGLGFLEPAMAEFLDETETLQSNVESMKNLSESLSKFNESFASWLYIMNMNALTVDWPQGPTPESFLRAQRRAEEDAFAALEALKEKNTAKGRELQIAAAVAASSSAHIGDKTAFTDVDTTFAANATTATGVSSNKSGTESKKKVPKGKLSAKEKKERSIEVERIISCLPLEFRGSDPGLRRNMESVIEGLMYASSALKITDLVKPPDLNQARVNKCLIALVNRKVIQKDNATGTVLYHWKGIP